MEPAPIAAAIRIAQPEAALFASDMHLDDSQPALAARFFDRLQERLEQALAASPAPSAEAAPVLFLLGDLFEYWIGDDHLPAVAQALSTRLAAFSRGGGRVFLMHGNRDFLMDAPLPSQPGIPAFSARCGATLLPDPCVIEVAGLRVGLSHGDALCTADARYQQWRSLCRSTAWQQQFLALPVDRRLALAQDLRKQSMQAQAVTETLSDVDQGAVDALMTQLQTNRLIHGHTHQPAVHRWSPQRLRWVLSDWSLAPARGDVLPLSAVIPPAC